MEGSVFYPDPGLCPVLMFLQSDGDFICFKVQTPDIAGKHCPLNLDPFHGAFADSSRGGINADSSRGAG